VLSGGSVGLVVLGRGQAWEEVDGDLTQDGNDVPRLEVSSWVVELGRSGMPAPGPWR
jgi:hypothetical protein